MDEDDLYYLQPGFNPASLTIPKLRSILLAHNISYTSSAKKGDLVQIFNDQLKPKAKKLLSARARTKRSSAGIEDLSSQASTVTEEDAEDEEPTPQPARRAPGRPRTRKASKQPEDLDDKTVVGASSTPAPSGRGRKSTKHARGSEPEPEERPAPKQSRRATRTPSVKPEELEPEPTSWHDRSEDSVFTDDNPFQSASSPPPSARSKSRRRTDGPPDDKGQRKTSGTRRKTDGAAVKQEEDIHPPSSHTFEVKVSDLARGRRGRTPLALDPLQPGEEFEPEEQLELETERRKAGNTAVIPVRRSHRSRPRSDPILVKALTAGLVVFLATLAHFYRLEKFTVGYCGIGHPSDRIAGVDIPDWAHRFRPACENCPRHATCYQNLQTQCEPGFVIQHHPLSLNGLLPLAPSCEPDGERVKRINAVGSRAVEELRIQNAKAECGELDDQGKPVKDSFLSEEELKRRVSSQKRQSMSDDEFDDLWKPALGEVLGRDEIKSRVDE
jgi:hypothetical protein